MSNISQGAADASARASSADTQQLIGLLENLVPLLIRFQSQSFGQPGPLHLSEPQNALLERQAAVAFTEDILLDALRNISGYLDGNAGRYPGLDTFKSTVAQARQALAVQDYQTAFGAILQVYRAVAVLRSIRSELPPIRERGKTERSTTDGAVH